MNEIKKEAIESSKDTSSVVQNATDSPSSSSKLSTLWENLLRFGLGGSLLRAGTGLACLILIL
ncbi:MAG: hypothetical protein ABFD58_01660 [Anaerolineaceae bacterium]